jgi:hypothetical protein
MQDEQAQVAMFKEAREATAPAAMAAILATATAFVKSAMIVRAGMAAIVCMVFVCAVFVFHDMLRVLFVNQHILDISNNI